jgi:molecular chaperone DnaK
MSGPVLGIDLGTTNSVVALAQGGEVQVLRDAEGNSLVPSVVSFHPNGEVLVGYPARERRLLDAKNTIYSVKRLIGRPFASDEVTRARERFPFALSASQQTGMTVVEARGETYPLPEISSFVLRKVRDVAEAALGVECTRAVVTVPANFNELQRSATKAAGRIAGLDVLRILNEPTAAALAYGYGRGSQERIAVYDFGGGTFDLTILELSGDVFEVIATAGDTFLGGDDIDVLVADEMAAAALKHHRYDPRKDAQAYERLRAAAEWAKCQLSTENDVQLKVEELAYDAGGRPIDLTFALARGALEKLIRPLVARSFDVCEDAMRVAGLRPTQLDNVVLVGGTTRIPLVRGMVRDYFAREPLGHIDPDLVVARGAAIQGLALAGTTDERPRRTTNVGKVALKKVTAEQLRASQVIPPKGPAFAPREQGAPVPAPRSAPPGATSMFDEFAGDEHDAKTRPGAALRSDEPLADEPTVARRSAPAPAPVPAQPKAQRIMPSSVVVAGQVSLEGSHPGVKMEATRKPIAPPALPPVAERRDTTARFGTGAADPPPLAPSIARPAPPPPNQRSPQPPSFPPPPMAPSYSLADQLEPNAPPPEPARPPPLLLDVTPISLGVETVGGYCEHVIRRNAAIPVEQTRVFSTSQDGQTDVSVRICQGESRKLSENQELGVIELTGLRAAARGTLEIGVTFGLDADGTLGVRARDLETGREQAVRISLVGGLGEQAIAEAAARQSKKLGR